MILQAKTIKTKLKWLIAHMPGCHAAARIVHRAFRRSTLTILMYHHVLMEPQSFRDWTVVTRSDFKRQMQYLKAYFEVVPLEEGLRRLRQGQLRRPTAVVTFDDGYQNNFDVAFPVLRALHLPATIFLSTAFVDSDRTFWAGRLTMALQAATSQQLLWNGKALGLGSPEGVRAAVSACTAYLKQLPHAALVREVDGLISQLGGTTEPVVPCGHPFRMLNRSSIAEMLDSGLITFGAHTHDHAILSLLSREQQSEQIRRSLAVVEEITGQPCHYFAYPNGGRKDYSRTTIELLRRYGVQGAVTTVAGCNDARTSALELKRIGVGGDWNAELYRFALHTGL